MPSLEIERGKRHMNKKMVVGIISILFVLTTFTTSIKSDANVSTILLNDGNLSGYVNDTLMNPIQGARVRVYFHGTYEEDYTDSSGYYHVINIPICYCLKNATASKEGYETEWILLSITENTTHDFVLTPLDPIPDLDCDGDLCWIDVVPGATVTGSFTVENIGGSNSELDWGIESYPEWGTWTFTPSSGTGLTPEDGPLTIDVEVIWSEEANGGEIKIVNCENSDDYCIIDISTAPPPPPQKLIGFIRDLEVTNYTVTFHAIIVLKVQYSFPGLIFNRQLVLPNNYEGYLSDCFVWATFSF